MHQKHMTNKTLKVHFRSLQFLTLALAELALVTVCALATNSPPQLQISLSGPSGHQTPELSWTAQPGAIYMIQCRTNLDPDSPWVAVEPVTTSSNLARWKAPELNAHSDSRFYQLVAPQPAIFRVEPTVVSTDGGLVYVVGQCLGTGGVARVAGLVLPPHVLQPGSTYSFDLPALPEGTYNVEWVEGGQVVASRDRAFTVTMPPGKILQRLLEPPVEPPASPSRTVRKRPGRTTYANITLEQGRAIAEPDDCDDTDPNVGPSDDRYVSDGGDCDDTSDLTYPAGTGRIVASAALKVKEKGNRTKSVSTFFGTDDSLPGDAGRIIAPAALKVKEKGNRTKSYPLSSLDPFSAAGLKVKEKGNRTKCTSNLRIAPNGEMQFSEVDLFIPGRSLDFVLERFYRSRSAARPGMTYNWTLSYDVSVSQRPDGGIEVFDGTGRSDVYYAGADGFYVRDEFFNEGSFNNGAFTLTFADTGRWEFNPFDGSPVAGKLSRIVDRNGNFMSLAYDGAGRLSEIVDDLGRTNRLSYNSSGLVQDVTDFSGRVVRYEYDGNRDLTACISPAVTGTTNGNDFPGGKTNHYAYSSGFADDRLNHNLTSMTDATGQAWLQVFYAPTTDPTKPAYDNVDYLQRGPYRIKHRRVALTPTPQNGFAVLKCIENDAVGNVTECIYDSQNRCVQELRYTGRANPDLPTTDTQNRPVNKLRDTDPDYFETRCEWNTDSLCTLITSPEGNSTEMIYERKYQTLSNASRRHAGDLRVLRERASCCIDTDSDGDGVPDATERTWRIEHDPRFGSGGAARKSGWVTSADFNYRDHSRTMAVGQVKLASSNRKRPGRTAYANITLEQGFVILDADAVGNQMGATYDNRGNRTKKYRRVLLQQGRVLHDADMPEEDYEYNTFGQCTAITNPADANGYRRVDTLAYYKSGPQAGYLQSVVIDDRNLLGLRLTTTFEYDARGNITRMTDPRGFVTDCIYNALDQCVRVDRDIQLLPRLRVGTVAYYDANDNVVRCDIENRDEKGVVGDPDVWRTQFQYDILNRATACWRDKDKLVLRCTTAQYDGNDNLALYRSGEAVNGHDPQSTVQFLYDERDLPFQTIYGPGSTQPYSEQYNYTRNGWKQQDIQGLDAPTLEKAVTTYEYDGFSRLVRATDPLFNVASAGYDVNDNLLVARFDETFDVGSASTRRLSETRWVYDGLYRPIECRVAFFNILTQSPIGDGASVSTRDYAPNGQLLSETDDNGHTTHFTYDTACRLNSVIDPKTNSLVYAYDSSGNVLSVTAHELSDVVFGEQIFVNSHGYDGLNRCTSMQDNVGNTGTFAYDSRGNRVSIVDPRGNETVLAYDGLNRCVGTTSYEGTSRTITINTTHVEYDDNSRCTSAKDANGNVEAYSYDSVNRLVMTTHADGTTERLIWSPRSNLASSTDANGTTVTYTRDLLDRCVRKDISVDPASGVMGTTSFEEFAYDGLSRLVLGSNDTSMVEFTYDSLGNREKAKADCIAAAATFDGVGNRLSFTYPGGRVVQCTYDALNRVTSVASAPLLHALYAYEGTDRLTRVARTNGVNTRIFWDGLQNSPNSPGDSGFRQVSRINHQRAGGGTVIAQRTFAYDANQNKISAVAAPFVPGGAIISSALRYDALDRLSNSVETVGGSVSQTTDYLLDQMGNRTKVMHLGGGSDSYSMDATLPEPGDFQMNQYTVTPFGFDHYDRNGNLVERDAATGPTFFRYDYADRLVEVSTTDMNGLPAPVASFSYDALGRRISKTTYPPAPAAPVKTQFIYDPDSDGDGIIEFRRDGVVVGTFVMPEVDDEVLVAFTGAGAQVYFHGDELGNILALTDETGKALEFYYYQDYGLPTVLDAKGLPIAQSALGNPFLFRGMFWDGELGSYHESGGGEFDPQTGRYRKREGGGLILHESSGRTFAGNNPWSPRGSRMSKGKVKFFNDPKGFGRSSVLFNPKEYSLDKVTVRGWDPKQKQGIAAKSWPSRYEGPRLDVERKILDRGEAGDNIGLLMSTKPKAPPREPRWFTGHVTLIK